MSIVGDFRSLYFSNKDRVLFFLTALISKIGDKIYLIAMPWLIYDLTESSIAMAFMFLVESLSFIFISPVAGVLADRYSPKKILIVSSAIQVTVLGLIAFLLSFQLLEVWSVFIIGLVVTSAGVSFSVVHGTMIPNIFPRDNLVKINAAFQFIDTSSILIGSSTAGILISFIGINNVFTLIAILFTGLFITINFFKLYHVKQPLGSSSWSQLKEGFHYVKNHSTIGPLSLLTFIINIANASLIAMLVFFARDELNLNSKELGIVYSVSSLVQIVAIFLIPIINKLGGIIKLMVINLLISSIGIIIVSFSSGWITFVIGIGVQSAPTIFFNVLFKTYRQEIVPLYKLGRVNGIISMISRAVFPVSGLLSGFLATAFDIRNVFLFLSLFSLVSVIYIYFKLLTKEEQNYVNI